MRKKKKFSLPLTIPSIFNFLSTMFLVRNKYPLFASPAIQTLLSFSQKTESLEHLVINATFNIFQRNIHDLPPLTKDPITSITYFSKRKIFISVFKYRPSKTMVQQHLTLRTVNNKKTILYGNQKYCFAAVERIEDRKKKTKK